MVRDSDFTREDDDGAADFRSVFRAGRSECHPFPELAFQGFPHVFIEAVTFVEIGVLPSIAAERAKIKVAEPGSIKSGDLLRGGGFACECFHLFSVSMVWD